MKPNSDKLIEQIVQNTRTLLQEHWARAEQVFAATNIKLNMQHLVDFTPENPTVKTTIAFGARVKDIIEFSVPDNELELPMQIEQKGKRSPKQSNN